MSVQKKNQIAFIKKSIQFDKKIFKAFHFLFKNYLNYKTLISLYLTCGALNGSHGGENK